MIDPNSFNFNGALGTEYTHDLPERAGRWGALVDSSGEFWQVHFYQPPAVKGNRPGKQHVLTHAGRFRFKTVDEFTVMLAHAGQSITRIKSMNLPDGAFMESHMLKTLPDETVLLGWYNAASNELAFTERNPDFSPVTLLGGGVACAGVIPAIGLEYLALMLLAARDRVAKAVTGKPYFKQ